MHPLLHWSSASQVGRQQWLHWQQPASVWRRRQQGQQRVGQQRVGQQRQ